MADETVGKVAIQFGASASTTTKKSARAAPTSHLGKRPRNHFGTNSDSSDDDEGKDDHEAITHFGANGASYEVEERSRRRDREHSGGRPHKSRKSNDGSRTNTREAVAPRPEKDAPATKEEEPLKFGLVIASKTKSKGPVVSPAKDNETAQPKTADEEAIAALSGATSDIKLHPAHRTINGRRPNEEDVFRNLVTETPDADNLDSYNNNPVEGFGASLLMGQGWDGKMRGPKAKEVVRLPNGLGLGAKKLTVDDDIAKWDQKDSSGGRSEKRPRLDEYRRDKEKEKSRREDRRGSYRSDGDRGRDRDHNRERDRDRERDRHGDDDRHRRHARDRESDRDRERHRSDDRRRRDDDRR